MFRKLFGKKEDEKEDKKEEKLSSLERSLRDAANEHEAAAPPQQAQPQSPPASTTEQPAPDPHETPEFVAAQQAMIDAAHATRAEGDNAKCLKIAAKTLNQNLLSALTDERGVHVETALGILGAVGGFWCVQHAITRAVADPTLLEGGTEQSNLVTAVTKDGDSYFFGDLINAPLFQDPLSIWGLSAGMAQHLGDSNLPDPAEMATHISASIGTPDFGIPRLSDDHPVHMPPIDMLKTYANWMLNIAKPYIQSSEELPAIAGFAVQDLMQQGKDVLAPGMAVRIVMECAAPMSHMDPRRIGLNPPQ